MWLSFLDMNLEPTLSAPLIPFIPFQRTSDQPCQGRTPTIKRGLIGDLRAEESSPAFALAQARGSTRRHVRAKRLGLANHTTSRPHTCLSQILSLASGTLALWGQSAAMAYLSCNTPSSRSSLSSICLLLFILTLSPLQYAIQHTIGI
jgi:hypothetical protein